MATERGQSTIITRRGRDVAVLAPAEALANLQSQRSPLTLEGSGQGLWGPDSTAALRLLREEGSR